MDAFVEVFVKNLDPWYDRDDKVQQLFKSCSLVVNVHLVRNERGAPIGVAYVTFAEPHMALKACQTLNGLKNRFGEELYVDRAFTRREWYTCLRVIHLLSCSFNQEMSNFLSFQSIHKELALQSHRRSPL